MTKLSSIVWKSNFPNNLTFFFLLNSSWQKLLKIQQLPHQKSENYETTFVHPYS
jgi:hypothetical protein